MPFVTLRIENLAAGGEGIARLDGKRFFVGMSAPGDKLVCRVTEDHGSWARAEPLEIVEASPLRVTPACALYGVCGGCDLQHLGYGAQLEAKTAILKDSFVRIGGFIPPEPKVFPSEPWEYRNRIQLHCIRQERGPAGEGGAPARLEVRGGVGTGASEAGFGFKARKSGEIIPLPDCPVAAPEIREALRKEARGEAALAPPPRKERFTLYGRNGLLLYEGGQTRGRTKILEREISLDASLFFQSNGAMLEKLILELKNAASRAAARSANGTERRMADLYSGVGTFACFLAEYFTHIDLMEENKSSLALARENLALKGGASPRENRTAEFFALRDTEWAKLRGRNYSFAVLDPPRQGLSPALVRALAEAGPPDLAYVSCAPATLARDSKILKRGGYELIDLYFYDFYPQTSHLESLALFTRSRLTR